MGGYCEIVMVGERALERYLYIFYILLFSLCSLGLLCLFCVVIVVHFVRNKSMMSLGIIGQASCLMTG